VKSWVFMKNLRGLSNKSQTTISSPTISGVLIIFVVVSLFIVLAYFSSRFVSSSSRTIIYDCQNLKLKVSEPVDGENGINVMVTRGVDKLVLKEIKFFVFDGKNTLVSNYSDVVNTQESKRYVALNPFVSNTRYVIRVAGIIVNDKNVPKECPVSSEVSYLAK